MIILFSTFWFSGESQLTYKFVDSVSYQLYTDHEWKELSDFGIKAKENSFDYYYLNLRIGIAYFEQKQYDNGITFFNRALKNNSASEIGKTYLFWSYLLIDDEQKANNIYKTLQDSSKKKINYKSSQFFDNIFAEGGLKWSSYTEYAGNITYFNFGINSKLSPSIWLYQAYTFSTQKLIWGEFKQNEYYLTSTFVLNKQWQISPSIHYANYKSNLDYQYNAINNSRTHIQGNGQMGVFIDSIQQIDYSIQGDFLENDLYFLLKMVRKGKHFSLSPYGGMVNSWIAPSYMETFYDSVNVIKRTANIIIDESTTIVEDEIESRDELVVTNGIVGLDAAFFGSNIMVGIDAFLTFNTSRSDFVFVPYLDIKMGERFSIWTYFVSKKAGYGISLFNGSQLMNSHDKIIRYSLTASINLSKKTFLFVTYQFEKVTDNLSYLEYYLNSGIVGIKFKI